MRKFDIIIIGGGHNGLVAASVLSKKGNTEVKIKIRDERNKYIINLKNKRFVDRKCLNLLKNLGISTNIL